MSPNLDTEQYPSVKSLFLAMRDRFQNWTLARECARRLDACDEYEVDRIARDFGLSRAELRRMAKLGPDSANLLLQRLDALHIDAATLNRRQPGVMRDLTRLCSQCASKGQCQRDLLSDSDNPVWRDYCPNENTLVALQGGAGDDKAPPGNR